MVCQMEPLGPVGSKEHLREYADVFAKDDLDLGHTSVVKYKITL